MSAGYARFTSLAREFHPRHPAHVFIGVAAAAGAATVAILRLVAGEDDPWGGALRTGLAIFLAWAIARELDPDRETSALVAAVIAPIWLAAGFDVAGAVVAMLCLRVVLRVTGNPLTGLDLAALVAIGAYLGAEAVRWPVLIGLGIAVAWDVVLPEPAPRRQYVAALAIVAAGAVVAALVRPDAAVSRSFDTVEIVLLAVGAVAVLRLFPVEPPVSGADHTGVPLDARRLAAARLAALGLAGLVALWLGGDGIGAVGPLWAAVVGTAAGSMIRQV